MTDPADLTGKVRAYWDADAATYDDSFDHGWAVASPARRAAWNAALHRFLPGRGSRVLDVGAGTGFLSLAAARLGHRVTALDLSAGMLARLRERAGHDGLQVEVVEGAAEEPPPGPFDAVMSGTCSGPCPTLVPPSPPGAGSPPRDG